MTVSPSTATNALRAGMFAAMVFAAPTIASASPSFPRGLGYYFDPVKLAVLIAAFIGWVKICAWVDEDAAHYKIPVVFWSSLLLVSGLAGFGLTWGLPGFWPAMIFASLAVLAISYWYISKRNRRASADDQLFNRVHFQRLAQKYFRPSSKKAAKSTASEGVPVKFMGRSTIGEVEDTDRDERVKQSKGYRAAQELVYDALERRATDIHLEPTANEMTVRLRIDGMMTNIKPFNRAMGDGVVNVFKVLSNLDITEKRKPQDGSFTAQVKSRIVEFRVATAGSVVGEKLVMRVLDSAAQLADLNQVGMTESMQTEVREIISRPHGLFLVCGPTGSGKSTTLYACLHEIDRFSQNIITVENPVEYRLDGVTQIEVNPKAGKTFASELRSILRQDPDVILIGEIRDKETAEIACQAAQTGHVVFSTVHANDSVTAIARMIDLGVPPFMLSSALQGVLAQRLVRKLCKSCRVRMKPSAETLKKLKIDPDAVRYVYRAFDAEEDKDSDASASELELCTECGGSGHQQRTGIFELLVLNEKIRELIRENPNIPEIRRVASDYCLKTLFEDGARLVIDGEISIQELLRVSK